MKKVFSKFISLLLINSLFNSYALANWRSPLGLREVNEGISLEEFSSSLNNTLRIEVIPEYDAESDNPVLSDLQVLRKGYHHLNVFIHEIDPQNKNKSLLFKHQLEFDKTTNIDDSKSSYKSIEQSFSGIYSGSSFELQVDQFANVNIVNLFSKNNIDLIVQGALSVSNFACNKSVRILAEKVLFSSDSQLSSDANIFDNIHIETKEFINKNYHLQAKDLLIKAIGVSKDEGRASIINDGGSLIAEHLNLLSYQEISNTNSGQIVCDDLILSAKSFLQQSNCNFVVNNSAYIKSEHLKFDESKFVLGGNGVIDGEQLEISLSRGSSLSAKGDLEIYANEIKLDEESIISSDNDLSLFSNYITNDHGVISSKNNAEIIVNNSINNAYGVINSQAKLLIKYNDSEYPGKSSAGINFINHHGEIEAKELLIEGIKGLEINNSDGKISGGQVKVLNAEGRINNKNYGSIGASNTLKLHSAFLDNSDHGFIFADKVHCVLFAPELQAQIHNLYWPEVLKKLVFNMPPAQREQGMLKNLGGEIRGKSSLSIKTPGMVLNNSGIMKAYGLVKIISGLAIYNGLAIDLSDSENINHNNDIGGEITAGYYEIETFDPSAIDLYSGELFLSAWGVIKNGKNSKIIAKGGGVIESKRAEFFNEGGLFNSTSNSKDFLFSTYGYVKNIEGVIQSARNLTINCLRGRLYNRDGKISVGHGHLRVNSTAFCSSGDQARINAVNATINTENAFLNNEESLIAIQDKLLINGFYVDNRRGDIIANIIEMKLGNEIYSDLKQSAESFGHNYPARPREPSLISPPVASTPTEDTPKTEETDSNRDVEKPETEANKSEDKTPENNDKKQEEQLNKPAMKKDDGYDDINDQPIKISGSLINTAGNIKAYSKLSVKGLGDAYNDVAGIITSDGELLLDFEGRITNEGKSQISSLLEMHLYSHQGLVGNNSHSTIRSPKISVNAEVIWNRDQSAIIAKDLNFYITKLFSNENSSVIAENLGKIDSYGIINENNGVIYGKQFDILLDKPRDPQACVGRRVFVNRNKSTILTTEQLNIFLSCISNTNKNDKQQVNFDHILLNQDNSTIASKFIKVVGENFYCKQSSHISASESLSVECGDFYFEDSSSLNVGKHLLVAATNFALIDKSSVSAESVKCNASGNTVLKNHSVINVGKSVIFNSQFFSAIESSALSAEEIALSISNHFTLNDNSLIQATKSLNIQDFNSFELESSASLIGVGTLNLMGKNSESVMLLKNGSVKSNGDNRIGNLKQLTIVDNSTVLSASGRVLLENIEEIYNDKSTIRSEAGLTIPGNVKRLFNCENGIVESPKDINFSGSNCYNFGGEIRSNTSINLNSLYVSHHNNKCSTFSNGRLQAPVININDFSKDSFVLSILVSNNSLQCRDLNLNCPNFSFTNSTNFHLPSNLSINGYELVNSDQLHVGGNLSFNGSKISNNHYSAYYSTIPELEKDCNFGSFVRGAGFCYVSNPVGGVIPRITSSGNITLHFTELDNSIGKIESGGYLAMNGSYIKFGYAINSHKSSSNTYYGKIQEFYLSNIFTNEISHYFTERALSANFSHNYYSKPLAASAFLANSYVMINLNNTDFYNFFGNIYGGTGVYLNYCNTFLNYGGVINAGNPLSAGSSSSVINCKNFFNPVGEVDATTLSTANSDISSRYSVFRFPVSDPGKISVFGDLNINFQNSAHNLGSQIYASGLIRANGSTSAISINNRNLDFKCKTKHSFVPNESFMVLEQEVFPYPIAYASISSSAGITLDAGSGVMVQAGFVHAPQVLGRSSALIHGSDTRNLNSTSVPNRVTLNSIAQNIIQTCTDHINQEPYSPFRLDSTVNIGMDRLLHFTILRNPDFVPEPNKFQFPYSLPETLHIFWNQVIQEVGTGFFRNMVDGLGGGFRDAYDYARSLPAHERQSISPGTMELLYYYGERDRSGQPLPALLLPRDVNPGVLSSPSIFFRPHTTRSGRGPQYLLPELLLPSSSTPSTIRRPDGATVAEAAPNRAPGVVSYVATGSLVQTSEISATSHIGLEGGKIDIRSNFLAGLNAYNNSVYLREARVHSSGTVHLKSQHGTNITRASVWSKKGTFSESGGNFTIETTLVGNTPCYSVVGSDGVVQFKAKSIDYIAARIFAGTRFTQKAEGNITLSALETTVTQRGTMFGNHGGKDWIDKPVFYKTHIVSGGDSYTHAGGDFINKGSEFRSKGDLSISVLGNIIQNILSRNYVAGVMKHKTKGGFLGTKTYYSEQVVTDTVTCRPEILSETGNLFLSSKGNQLHLGASLSAPQGKMVLTGYDIKLDSFVFRNEHSYSSTSNSIFGSSESSVTYNTNQIEPTYLVSRKDLVLIAARDLVTVGSKFYSFGKIYQKAGRDIINKGILETIEQHQESSSFSLMPTIISGFNDDAGPGPLPMAQTVINKEPLFRRLNDLFHSGSAVSAVSHTAMAIYEGLSLYRSLSDNFNRIVDGSSLGGAGVLYALGERYGITDLNGNFDPRFTLGYTESSSTSKIERSHASQFFSQEGIIQEAEGRVENIDGTSLKTEGHIKVSGRKGVKFSGAEERYTSDSSNSSFSFSFNPRRLFTSGESAASGMSIGYSTSEQSASGVRYSLAQVEAKLGIKIDTDKDVEITDVIMVGDELEINADRLLAQSRQSTNFSSQSGFSFGASMTSVSFTASAADSDRAWVDCPTLLVGRKGVKIDTKSETWLRGVGVVAPEGKGLTIITPVLKTEDIENHDKSDSMSIGMSLSAGPSAVTVIPICILKGHNTYGKTFTTLVGKTVDVRTPEGAPHDISKINRDLNQMNITTSHDEWDVHIELPFDIGPSAKGILSPFKRLLNPQRQESEKIEESTTVEVSINSDNADEDAVKNENETQSQPKKYNIQVSKGETSEQIKELTRAILELGGTEQDALAAVKELPCYKAARAEFNSAIDIFTAAGDESFRKQTLSNKQKEAKAQLNNELKPLADEILDHSAKVVVATTAAEMGHREAESVHAFKQVARVTIEKMSDLFEKFEPAVNFITARSWLLNKVSLLKDLVNSSVLGVAAKLAYSQAKEYLGEKLVELSASYIASELYSSEDAQKPETQAKIMRFIAGVDLCTSIIFASGQILKASLNNFKNCCSSIRDKAADLMKNEPQLAHVGAGSRTHEIHTHSDKAQAHIHRSEAHNTGGGSVIETNTNPHHVPHATQHMPHDRTELTKTTSSTTPAPVVQTTKSVVFKTAQNEVEMIFSQHNYDRFLKAYIDVMNKENYGRKFQAVDLLGLSDYSKGVKINGTHYDNTNHLFNLAKTDKIRKPDKPYDNVFVEKQYKGQIAELNGARTTETMFEMQNLTSIKLPAKYRNGQGVDNLWRLSDGTIVALESKFSSTGKAKMNVGKTSEKVEQMSAEWFKKLSDNMMNDKNPYIRETGKLLENNIDKIYRINNVTDLNNKNLWHKIQMKTSEVFTHEQEINKLLKK